MSQETNPLPQVNEAIKVQELPPTTEFGLIEKNDQDEIISTSSKQLNVVGRPLKPGYEGGYKYQGVLTDNPRMMLALYEDGPLGLDRPEFNEGGEVTVIAASSETVSVNPKYESLSYKSTLSLSADKMITINFGNKRVDIAPSDSDPTASVVEADIEYGKENNLSAISKNSTVFTGYRNNYGYNNVPQIRATYERLGLSEPELDSIGNPSKMQVPTPKKLAQQVRAVQEDTSNIVDLPQLEFVKDGAISPTDYVDIISNGKFPVGANDMYYYMHDIASEHLGALLQYGDPLMDLMARFAKSVKNQDTIHFSEYMQDDQNGELTGNAKYGAAAQRLDSVTTMMAYLSVDRVSEEQNRSKHNMNLIGDFVAAMREANELDDSIVAHAILERGRVERTEDITAEHVVDEIIELTREKFDIQVKPKTVKDPEPSYAIL